MSGAQFYCSTCCDMHERSYDCSPAVERGKQIEPAYYWLKIRAQEAPVIAEWDGRAWTFTGDDSCSGMSTFERCGWQIVAKPELPS